MSSIYLIGSLRNPAIPMVAEFLRTRGGHDVFDDWHAAGPEADDKWQEYEQRRGRSYREALDGYAVWHTFSYDEYHLNRCDTVVLVMPAGKSGHLEFGYAVGKGKRGFVFFAEGYPERWDAMYRFASGVTDSIHELAVMVE